MSGGAPASFGRLTATPLRFKGDARPAVASSQAWAANKASKKRRKKEEKKKKKKQKKANKRETKAKRKLGEVTDGQAEAGGGEDVFVPVQKVGKGRIISSGTVVTGKNTVFMLELEVGDAIVINHPTSLEEETRIVKMVLSSMSIGISTPFSSDLVSPTRFHFIKKPKAVTNEEEAALKRMRDVNRKKAEEQQAFGTYASEGGTTVTYRTRKAGAYGSWKIVTEKANRTLSREELLVMRTKKKSDRHCNV